MRNLIDLFISFFKIGAFTFGGGYAMLPMIQKEIVEKHGGTIAAASENEKIEFTVTLPV